MEVVVVGGEKLYSQNLRDFLRIKEEDHRHLNASTSSSSGGGRRNSTGLTLSAVLSEKGGLPPPVDEPPPPLQRIQSNRTLLDIIREDQTPGLDRANADGRSSWRHLKDKIRLRRRGTGAAWSSAVPLRNNSHWISTISTRQHPVRFNSNTDLGESTQPGVNAPSSLRSPSRLSDAASGRFRQTISLAMRRSVSEEGNEEARGRDAAEAAVEGGGSSEHPARTSLMTLLAENDRQMGFESSAYTEGEEEAVEDTGGAVSASAGSGGVEYNSCCVCMVRHKGAAFIPCGHTFCRQCSRELWVQRGNCPLCNNSIQEILDIF